MNDKYKLGIIGLGYVGLPLACIFARKYPVVGFDTNRGRVEEIARGEDRNGDILHEKLAGAVAGGLRCTADLAALRPGTYDVAELCVAHDCFRQIDMDRLCRSGGLLFDVRGTPPLKTKCKYPIINIL